MFYVVMFKGTTSRLMSSKPVESAEAFDARWEAYFNRFTYNIMEYFTECNSILIHRLNNWIFFFVKE